ncbi:MAG: hypothetical protein NTX50_30540 [Candidatus Sumerlaeota bacterium]|nr:hypothetical protein [Candidatus Sumerlaeota bacterium]
MSLIHRDGGFGKEWRAGLKSLWPIAVVMILVITFAVGYLRSNASIESFWLLAMMIAFACPVSLLGLGFFDKEDFHPAGAFRSSPPAIRRSILGEKLAALGAQWAALAVLYIIICALLPPLWNRRWPPMLSENAPLAAQWGGAKIIYISLCAGMVSTALIVAFSLLMRLALFAGAFGLIAWVFCAKYISASAFGANIPIMAPAWDGAVRWFCFESIALSAALVGWVFFAACHTRLMERGAWLRAYLAILFGAIVIEMSYTIFLCDWRELVFVVFGM